MNKKNLIIGIIVLIILIIGVVLWNQKNSKQDTKQEVKQQVVKQTQEQKTTKEQSVVQKDGNNQNQANGHLSPEEIEKLKKEKDLVWYEIPELNIKFLVTKDTKDDLGYIYKKVNDSFNVTFYSKSETDKELTGCILTKDGGWSCGLFQLSFMNTRDIYKYNDITKSEWCVDTGGVITLSLNDEFICSYSSVDKNDKMLDNQKYRDFFHIKGMKDNIFGFYLDSIQKNK